MPNASIVAIATLLVVCVYGCSSPQSEQPALRENMSLAAHVSENDSIASARTVIRHAISYLEQSEARRLVVEVTHPDKLKALVTEGRLEQIVARFEGNWGQTLLSKLRDTVQDPHPKIRDSGAIEFSVSGALGPMSNPVVLGEHSGRWYFIE